MIHEQPCTAVYQNPNGQLVIRQRVSMPEDDPYVVISIEHLPMLIALLTGYART